MYVSEQLKGQGDYTIMAKYKDKRLNEEVPASVDLSNYYTKDETDALIPAVPDQLSDLSDDSTHRLVTDTEKSTWNAKAPALGADDNYVTDLEKAKLPQMIIFTYNL